MGRLRRRRTARLRPTIAERSCEDRGIDGERAIQQFVRERYRKLVS